MHVLWNCMYFGTKKIKIPVNFLHSVKCQPQATSTEVHSCKVGEMGPQLFRSCPPPPAPLEFWEFFWVGGREREIEGLGLFFLNVSKKKNYQRSCLERWLTDLQTIKAYSGGEKRKL